ncbi:MAG: OsmC family protein [Planctomycetaceae bacterium]|nr:OsmC family protein [Planctomycetaceae bacterium]
MDRETLRNLQAPLKALYQEQPEKAVALLHATGDVDVASITCRLTPPPSCDGMTVAGLHPMTGGDGTTACSGDMLLQSLVSCAGVTLAAVSTAMELPLRSAHIEAVGRMDFRGTLGVSREAPVGLFEIELLFQLTGDLSVEQADKLIQLAERYCVVLQTLKNAAKISSRHKLNS